MIAQNTVKEAETSVQFRVKLIAVLIRSDKLHFHLCVYVFATGLTRTFRKSTSDHFIVIKCFF